MYQVKMFDAISNEWKPCLACSYSQAIDLFDAIQLKARTGEKLQHEFEEIEVTAIKLVELGSPPDYRERNVVKYTEIRRKK